MPAPTRFVALFRALNVGGHGVVKMADLRASFEAFGATDVTTHIQSGNVLFTSRSGDADRVARALEAHLAKHLGCTTTAFVFSRQELERAAAHNPFSPRAREATQRCQLMFLSAAPTAERRDALMAVQRDDYLFHVHQQLLYIAYAKSLGGNRRSVDFERVLGVRGTARAWNVIDALIALLGDDAKPPAKRAVGRRAVARPKRAASR